MSDHTHRLEESLAAASRSPAQPAPWPTEEPTLDQAYDVQRRMMTAASLPIMVWKLGLTGEGPREAYGAAEPAVGRLPASAIFNDRSDIAYRGNEMYAEAELVFEMGADLPALDRPYTRDDVAGALMGVYAGIEIVRTRFATSDLTLPLLVADNVMAHGLVLGRKLAHGWEDRFADMPVALARGPNGAWAETVEGSTTRVMGNPLDALVWLANWLRKNEGCSLTREQLVASGTCTGATNIFAEDTVRVDFDGVEGVRVTLRAEN